MITSLSGESRHPKAEERSSPASAPGAPQISEFVVSVSAVLETTGVDSTARQCVMGVVTRLVDRLQVVEEEKDSATLQLKGEAAPSVSRGWRMITSCRDGGESLPSRERVGGAEGEGGRSGG